jgi:2-polyprenyl-3-methyl-5-hydroxy-6-metoxy-1,4-benzoquinol methylase
MTMLLEERTVSGLHDFLDPILKRYAIPGGRAIDLGAGSGALAVRLRDLGYEVIAVDINGERYKADIPFISLNLNSPDFSHLGNGVFDFIAAVEVIEHLENPITFLRHLRSLCKSDGIALITTPNMDNLPSRFRFLLTGKLHMMDEKVPNHISPIFYDLFIRQYLPRAGLKLVEHHFFPKKGYKVSRKRYSWIFRLLARIVPGTTLLGDVHIFVLKPVDDKQGTELDGTSIDLRPRIK